MKIYFHFSTKILANTYLIGNEETREAIIIDPGKITNKIVEQIENNQFKLRAVLITHNSRRSEGNGLKSVLRIYSPEVYAGDSELDGKKVNCLRGDGVISLAGFNINYYAIPGHAADSYMFKINNVIFIGASLSAGMTGKTANIYEAKILQKHLIDKLMNLSDDTVIMPAYGPPSSIGVERKLNSGLFVNIDINNRTVLL